VAGTDGPARHAAAAGSFFRDHARHGAASWAAGPASAGIGATGHPGDHRHARNASHPARRVAPSGPPAGRRSVTNRRPSAPPRGRTERIRRPRRRGAISRQGAHDQRHVSQRPASRAAPRTARVRS